MLIFFPKMTNLLQFVHNENFPESIKTGTFICFLKPFIRYSFRKLMNRFREKFKILHLDPIMPYRSSRPEVSLEKAILRICSKFTEEHSCQSVISIKLQSSCKVIEITLRHRYCPVNSNIFRTKFPKNTTRRLLLALVTYFGPLKISSKNCSISFA